MPRNGGQCPAEAEAIGQENIIADLAEFFTEIAVAVKDIPEPKAGPDPSIYHDTKDLPQRLPVAG